MPNWTDKDTDKLFQQGSEQYDFEYNSAAWEQMGKLLDREKRRRVFIWRAVGIFGAGLLSLSVFLLWANWPHENNVKQAEEKQENPIQSNENLSIDPSKTLDIQANKKTTDELPNEMAADNKNQKIGLGETGKQESTPPHTNSLGEERDATNRKTPTAQRKASQGNSRAAANGDGPTSPPANAKSGNGQEGAGQLEETIVVEGAPTSGTLAENSETSRLNEKAALLPGLSYLPMPNPGIEFNSKMPDLPTLRLAGDDHKENEKASPGNMVLVGIGLGPELNSVGFGDFSRLNWKFGLSMEYRYQGKLGLGIGANYIHMRYVAGQGEFKLPSTFPFLDKLVATRGTCDMLELPIDLSYYTGKKSGLIAAVGISSYLIFNEEYYYDYTYYNPNHIHSWSTDKNGSYWFGLGTVSLGYHHWVSERMTMRLMPYMQFPLRGVGQGKVKLNNIGASLRLDFALVK